MKPKSQNKSKEKIAISIDIGMKEALESTTTNVSDYINRLLHAALKKCPVCGSKK